MTSEPSSATEQAQPFRLPPFYQAPEPLHAKLHGTWRLKDGDASFAAQTPYVPIVVGEMVAAANCYPIVFAGEEAQPLAVLGLEHNNLFVDSGAWHADSYVPAYVRRYPFGFIATGEDRNFVLAVDAASARIVRSGEEGRPLFDDGKPSELTRQALEFCETFQMEAAATKEYGKALQAQGLLIERRADITLPDGRKYGLDGFRVVDAEKFTALPDKIIIEWHRKGYLAWTHFHLASLDRFRALLQRQKNLADLTGTSPGTAAEADKAVSGKGGTKGRKSQRANRDAAEQSSAVA